MRELLDEVRESLDGLEEEDINRLLTAFEPDILDLHPLSYILFFISYHLSPLALELPLPFYDYEDSPCSLFYTVPCTPNSFLDYRN